MKPLLVREELIRKKIHFFTPLQFELIFQTSPIQTKYFLETQTKTGFLWRLKKGLYTLKTDKPAEEEVANALYKPSYISFEYALAYHHILPEMVYEVTSATTKPTRRFETNSLVFGYYTIDVKAYTGYVLVKKPGKEFLIAEPEKALVDYLYFVSLGKKQLNDRFSTRNIDVRKAMVYAKLYERKSLIDLLQQL